MRTHVAAQTAIENHFKKVKLKQLELYEIAL